MTDIQMQPITFDDVIAAARVLYRTSPHDREDTLIDMIWETKEGFMSNGHAVFGTGALAHNALRRCTDPTPQLSDPEWVDCLQMVLSEVQAQYTDVRVAA